MNTPSAFLRLAALALLAVLCCLAALPAQTPPPPARRLPPAGIQISSADRAELTRGAQQLRTEIDALAEALAAAGRGPLLDLLPDVEVLHKAVDWPLRYDEFFDLRQVATARELLALGRERVAQLRSGQAPWRSATGTVLRGHRSRLDGSVQPYAITVPADWNPADRTPRRLDVVLLGRGEKRSELAFFAERRRPPGDNDWHPPGAFVLHPYGRFCNATKFAGEVDVFEALAAARRDYPVDSDRLVVRGFSMGGASTWHLAVHHPHVWAAAGPGAGFAETARYTRALAPGRPERMPWERVLWRWYDATGYAANLRHLPVVAYSGELDPQKQAADVMAEALQAEGLSLEHHIGPGMGHKFDAASRHKVAARLTEFAARGRVRDADEETFTTYTLRYPRSARLHLHELEQHWERADVRLRRLGPTAYELVTRNVVVFSVDLPTERGLALTVDGQPLSVPAGSAPYWLVRASGRWQVQGPDALEDRWRQPRKTPGRTGPINDAFLQPFLFVRPTGKPLHAAQGAWVEAELTRATQLWRALFRGEPLIKDDVAVTDADLAERNVILWGDPSSNQLLARLLPGLPLQWDATRLSFRGRDYSAADHVPLLIFPTPGVSAPRYVVLNSGIDFRDEAFGTNALQTPKLPDYAIVDLREPPDGRWPGRIVDAGFFDEGWR